MNNFEFTSNCIQDTIYFGKSLASKLNKKDIIILSGELGSGKTKFTEGFLTYFGLENEISSPTFTIVNEYKTDKINIYHFDVYRLEDSSEFYEIGGEEYFENGICLIEWGELILNALPEEYIEIKIKKAENDENKRFFKIITHGSRFDTLFNDNTFKLRKD